MKVYQSSCVFRGDVFDLCYLFKDQPGAFFLDSSLRRSQSQFSYIGFAPMTTVNNLNDLKKWVRKYRIKSTLPFPAGAVGYLGYDGSVYFGIYDTIIAVDHRHQRLIFSSLSQKTFKNFLPRTSGRWDGMKAVSEHPQIRFTSNFTKKTYIGAINKALKHIKQGDIYQINLSHKIKLSLRNWQRYVTPLNIYSNLRQAFPSEFGAYLDDGKQVILSASPERFLKLEKGIAQVKPMKGTRPRGKNQQEDRRLKRELLNSAKEKAELLMVTDLERNDLGRVCDFSSVKVSSMRAIETYSSVFQATSTIQGKLRADCDQFDLLQATFPSGSVTGCPKIEALKIIKRLERGPRELYTGALGYISFTGGMDFNVMIRTMFLKKNEISFHMGGGIVADSNPQDEWQETWDKAKPLIETLKRSFR